MADEVNTDELTIDQIRALADKEVEVPAETVTQPEPAEQADAEQTETLYERRIDLGDGSGVQVFRANSLEGLVDKLTDAQENATRKIRELSQQKKRDEPKEEPPVEFSADEEFLLTQEMMQSPSKAIATTFKRMTGYDIAELKTVKQRADAWDQAQIQQAEGRKWDEAANAFVAGHPEYLADEKNGRRLRKEIATVEGEFRSAKKEIDHASIIETAYRNLTEDGLIRLKEAEEPIAEPAPQARAERIAEPVPTAQKRASGLSGRTGTPAPKPQGPTEDDLYNMPLDQLKELANKAGR